MLWVAMETPSYNMEKYLTNMIIDVPLTHATALPASLFTSPLPLQITCSGGCPRRIGRLKVLVGFPTLTLALFATMQLAVGSRERSSADGLPRKANSGAGTGTVRQPLTTGSNHIGNLSRRLSYINTFLIICIGLVHQVKEEVIVVLPSCSLVAKATTAANVEGHLVVSLVLGRRPDGGVPGEASGPWLLRVGVKGV